MTQPVPILFIHGFNGIVENWELAGFRQALVARGADPNLLRLFHYGWREPATPDGERVYNNQGDIRQIAARLVYGETDDELSLHSQIRRLSEASEARGGPTRVTLVAHSMGGLIARYYLSRQEPDEWGTVNEGLVRLLVTIGTPHLGLEVARLTALVPPDAFIWRVLRALQRLPFVRGQPAEELAQWNAQVLQMQAAAQAEELPVVTQGILDSPALAQMRPGSAFIQALNAPGAFPAEVAAALIWGDVYASGSVRWGPVPLWERTLSLGDLLVSARSASTLPNAPAQHFPQRWGVEYMVQVGNPSVVPAALDDYLPPVAHSALLRHPTVHETVARLVGL